MSDSLEQLTQEIRAFSAEREWDQFHTPKNLAMALLVEAAELAEIFQWMTPEESQALDQKRFQHAREELGDVLIYLVNMASRLGIDPVDAARSKLIEAARKYPAAQVRGSARKYTEYRENTKK